MKILKSAVEVLFISQIWFGIILSDPTSITNYLVYENKSLAPDQAKTMTLSHTKIYKDMDKEFHCMTQCSNSSNCLVFVYSR